MVARSGESGWCSHEVKTLEVVGSGRVVVGGVE